MIKRMLILCAFLGLISSVASTAFAFNKTYCVWVYCQNSWGSIINNADQKAIVRTAEFAGASRMSGEYYLNKSVFDELVAECAQRGTPIAGGILYGKNAAKGGLGFMWQLLPADQAARTRPNDPPSIVANDKRCQAMEQ